MAKNKTSAGKPTGTRPGAKPDTKTSAKPDAKTAGSTGASAASKPATRHSAVTRKPAIIEGEAKRVAPKTAPTPPAQPSASASPKTAAPVVPKPPMPTPSGKPAGTSNGIQPAEHTADTAQIIGFTVETGSGDA